MSDPATEQPSAAQPVASSQPPLRLTTGNAAGGSPTLTLSTILLALWHHGFAILGLAGVVLAVLISAPDVFSISTIKRLVLALAVLNAVVAYLKKVLPNQPPG